mgnify:CR=1 FL=1
MEDVRTMKAREVMTENVVGIDEDESVVAAIAKMKGEGVSSLLVNRYSSSVQAPEEDTWGIVTRKDVVNKVIDPGKKPSDLDVHQIMTKPVIIVYPGLDLKHCARLMHMAGIRRAPVFDGNEIVGILSNTDIFNAVQV